MNSDTINAGYAAIADLGRKIGISKLATEDFDLIFADASGVDTFCDQFEAIDLTHHERFHFMQLIVASLDLALENSVPGSDVTAKRVERLLMKNLADYKDIIDYWGGADSSLHTVPMMQRLKKDSRYIQMDGEAPFE